MGLNVEQPNWVPAITKLGYKKEKIPEELYKVL